VLKFLYEARNRGRQFEKVQLTRELDGYEETERPDLNSIGSALTGLAAYN
jgi:hypothetical protein